MNKGFNELIEYLDKKFQKTAKKEDLDELSLKLVTREEFAQFKKEVKQELSGLRESIQALLVSVDRLVKAIDTLRTEYGAVSLQLDRHEKWIQQIAEKTGLKLEY